MRASRYPTPSLTLAGQPNSSRRAVRAAAFVLWGFALGASMMLEIVHQRIGLLISQYDDPQMALGVYNLYDHLVLYRFGFGGAALLLSALLFMTWRTTP